jgi:two-component system chemotaxis response regulator CheB
VRVLIVDDSSVFRTQIRRALSDVPDIEVVGSASNGRIALQMLEQKPTDLVTLDLNMADMDGMETLREIRRRGLAVRVLVFAARSTRSAEDTIEALRCGADDFVLKPGGDTLSIEHALEQVRSDLVPKIRQFTAAMAPTAAREPVAKAAKISPQALSKKPRDLATMRPMVVVVASSTGGPGALEALFASLPRPPRVPILVAQHMPETFTKFLAKRLADISGVACREAQNGEPPTPGTIYIAPGNFHMQLRSTPAGNRIALDQGPKVNSVRPAADLLFASAAELYGDACAAFVLTGMGSDGLEGARRIKNRGGAVMIQSKESCVVWGMPAAVHDAGAYDRIGDLQDCAGVLARLSA